MEGCSRYWHRAYGLDGAGFESNQTQGIYFQNVQRGYGANLAFYSRDSGSLRVKGQKRGVDHLPSIRAAVKNGGSYTSTPPTCLCGVDRNKFFYR
jgi:hypothetical protein